MAHTPPHVHTVQYVHIVYPSCMSLLPVQGACQYCLSKLHIIALSPCCMLQHVLHIFHIHAACPRRMLMSMLHVLAAFPCCISVLHAHVHAACHVLSFQSFPGSPVLAAPSWRSWPGSLILPVLFCLSSSACPVLPVLFCLCCSAYPVLPVLFRLSWLSFCVSI
jgi:hypothetical protein